mgnify:CR=1 FL=1
METLAYQNLKRIHPEMEERTAQTLKILMEAGLPCREHQDEQTLQNLATAVKTLWRHLAYLDPENLDRWNISIWELASIYGRATQTRTFEGGQS